MKKLKRKVDKTVSGLNNGGDKPATFRTAQRSMQPGGYYGRSGYGYAGPPPWIGGLLGWAALFGAAWAVTKSSASAAAAAAAARLPPSAAGASAAPGRRTRSLGQRPNPRRARNLGGGPIRQGRARQRARRVALDLVRSSEAADKARRKEEAKAAAAAAAASDAVPPRGGARPRPGTAPSLSARLG